MGFESMTALTFSMCKTKPLRLGFLICKIIMIIILTVVECLIHARHMVIIPTLTELLWLDMIWNNSKWLNHNRC